MLYKIDVVDNIINFMLALYLLALGFRLIQGFFDTLRFGSEIGLFFIFIFI